MSCWPAADESGGRGGSGGGLVVFSEDCQGGLVGVEGSRGAGVGGQVDEELDDFFLGHAGVQSYPELAAEWFVGAEGGGDGYGDERAGAVVQARARPGSAEGLDGGQAAEVLSYRRLAFARREDQRLAEQALGGVQRMLVVPLGRHGLWHRVTPREVTVGVELRDGGKERRSKVASSGRPAGARCLRRGSSCGRSWDRRRR